MPKKKLNHKLRQKLRKKQDTYKPPESLLNPQVKSRFTRFEYKIKTQLDHAGTDLGAMGRVRTINPKADSETTNPETVPVTKGRND